MNNLIVFIYKYGTIATCLIILIEYACFPISSEIVLPFSGAIAKINNFNLHLLIILSVICGTLGSCICYFIGRILGSKCIKLITNKYPKTTLAFNSSISFYNRYGNKAVLIARVIPLCRTYISFISGMLKQSLISFIIFSSIGILIWNTVLISLGYFLGEHWKQITLLYTDYKYIILSILLITLLLFLIYKRMNSKKNNL